MKIKHKIYISQILLVLLIITFTTFTFLLFNKHYQQDIDNYVDSIVSLKTNEFLTSLEYISYKMQIDQNFYKKINEDALSMVQKNDNPNLEEIKENLIKRYALDENLNIELYLLNNDLIIYDSTYKRDIGFDLKTVSDTQYYIDMLKKENKITFTEQLAYDSIDKKYKQYSLVKIDDKRYLEMGFIDNDFNKPLNNIFKEEDNELFKTKFYRIAIDTEYEVYYDINAIEIIENKADYYKTIDKFYYDEETDDPVINSRREFKDIKIVNDNSIDIYHPIMNNEVLSQINNGTICIKISINIENKKNLLYKFELVFMTLLILFIIFLISGFIWIKNNFTKKTDLIASSIQKSHKIKDKKILSSKDEFGVIARNYNKLVVSLKNEIYKNINLLNDNKRFIADTVHQIRTPLSVIMMNSDLIKIYQEDATTEEFLNQINSSINMLTNSYEDLAYITSHDSLEYAPVNLNISNILQERIEFFRTIADVNAKNFTYDIKNDIYFNINQIEFERVVDNNISNAIKYAENNKTITIILKEHTKSYEIEFKSYGKPIKNPAKVFEKDYRENEEKRGLGLGLNMVKNICNKYHITYKLSYSNNQNIFTYKFTKI